LKTLGRVEWIRIRSKRGKKQWGPRLEAKLDTGADWSRIGAERAAELRLGPIEEVHEITTSNGAKENRIRVAASVRIGGVDVDTHFVVSTTREKVTIGLNTMKDLSHLLKFTIDPTRTILRKTGKRRAD
jgi:predicted aspartyl protease